jgi:FAD dependent oxidoreductase TIGR03364
MYELAMRSRAIWLEVLQEALLPHWPDGALHVVYRDDEAEVAREFAERGPDLGYQCGWLDRDETLARSPAIQPQGLLGALWSSTEITVDPRLTLRTLPVYLRERFDVEIRFGCAVRRIELPLVEAGNERWIVDRAIVCAGEDFESLFPEAYAGAGLTRVKLQMLRTAPQPEAWRLGPALAAGLTLRFYSSFQICHALDALKKRILEETPEYERWGIHGLVSQTAAGELTLGDSHEYGLAVDIFNREEVDCLILRYIRTFLQAPHLNIAERWYGVYAKHSEKPYLCLEPAPGVSIVTSPGGAGMTLSFGVAAKTIEDLGL